MRNILITGGAGLIGRHLSKLLLEKGYKVGHLTRNPDKKIPNIKMFGWNIETQDIDMAAIPWADQIIHLAGETVGQRWTKSVKKKIVNSRINSTRLIERELRKGNKVESIIGASALGFYGDDTGDKVLTEVSPKGVGFLSDVVEEWEEGVDDLKDYVERIVKIRIGIVLTRTGGALAKITLPIKYGLGAALGSGKQWMSWIHLDDLCRMFLFTLENPVSGVFIGVSPEPASNLEFTKALAKKLKRTLLLPPVPKIALRLLLGEMSILVLGSNRAKPAAFQEEGFTFEYSTLKSALDSLL